jgi:hypothetical protein
MNTIKTATMSKVEPTFVDADGTQHSYVPRSVTTARDAYAATLHLIFNHIADFHSVMITIISEKYGIPEEDIFNTVRADPRFGSMVTDPVVQSMGYFDEDELSAAMTKMSVKAGDTITNMTVAAAEPTARVAAELTVQPAKKVLKKPLKKKVVSLDDE